MVFFTSVDPMNKEHRDPNIIDLEAPRLARYHQKKWKKHQNTVYWVDIRLAQKKGLKFYQTRCNAIILYDTLPAYCIPKAIMMETGEIIYEKSICVTSPPPKIPCKDNWRKELCSEVAGGSEDSQQTQPKTKNPIVRTGRPEDKDADENVDADQIRTVRPVESGQCIGLFTQREEIDIDFRVSGLPHAVVKQAENFVFANS